VWEVARKMWPRIIWQRLTGEGGWRWCGPVTVLLSAGKNSDSPARCGEEGEQAGEELRKILAQHLAERQGWRWSKVTTRLKLVRGGNGGRCGRESDLQRGEMGMSPPPKPCPASAHIWRHPERAHDDDGVRAAGTQRPALGGVQVAHEPRRGDP
jgi:hypothetical protein